MTTMTRTANSFFRFVARPISNSRSAVLMGTVDGYGVRRAFRKVLFHLNEVTEAIANDHAILIAEGEKDVLNLERIGLPATCNPGGASEPGKKSKWRKEYSEALRGADIIIVPDHDLAGYAHADAIASMSAGLAKSVRILKLAHHWPDCPKGRRRFRLACRRPYARAARRADRAC